MNSAVNKMLRLMLMLRDYGADNDMIMLIMVVLNDGDCAQEDIHSFQIECISEMKSWDY